MPSTAWDKDSPDHAHLHELLRYRSRILRQKKKEEWQVNSNKKYVDD